jgi:cell wall-associated NlpC family hydrolase
MRLRAHVRTKIGAVVMAVATAVAIAPAAMGVPDKPATAEAAPVVAPKRTGKRHWMRNRWFGGWHAASRRHPTVIEVVMAAARAQLGKPYVYGNAGPGSFDCSGLTQFVWAKAGVALPHNAAAQYASVRHVPAGAARPGDLVFSSGLGHVGIYIGGGRMIHAPQSGERVEISPLHANTVGFGRPGR